jgi:PTS system nitrogen regulatory IIA component
MNRLISEEAIFIDCEVASKKQLLEKIALKASRLFGFEEHEVFDCLMQRERLGSTGLGGGIAIPHAKLPQVAHVTGIFMRLSHPVEFEAVDDAPVDIVCALFAPQGSGSEHLKALSRLARTLRDEHSVQELRQATTTKDIYAVLNDVNHSQAA